VSDELQLVAAENHRLLREVKELRERVAAYESSRWWRLHPRFLLRRDGKDTGAAPTEPKARPQPPEGETARRFRAEVVQNGSFQEDWFVEHIPLWEVVIRALEGRPARVLEIGSYEGLSACYVLWRLPAAHITCIDTFEGSPEHDTMGISNSFLEERFDRNVTAVDSLRVTKIVGRSASVLPTLLMHEPFDLVYVDGSHLALDVLVDASLAWQLAAADGFVIFDDYAWRSPLGEDLLLRPGPAIDAVLRLVGPHCEVLEKSAQVILRKTLGSRRGAAGDSG
jgi:Methyltransferase domain